MDTVVNTARSLECQMVEEHPTFTLLNKERELLEIIVGWFTVDCEGVERWTSKILSGKKLKQKFKKSIGIR